MSRPAYTAAADKRTFHDEKPRFANVQLQSMNRSSTTGSTQHKPKQGQVVLALSTQQSAGMGTRPHGLDCHSQEAPLNFIAWRVPGLPPGAALPAQAASDQAAARFDEVCAAGLPAYEQHLHPQEHQCRTCRS